MKRNSQRGCMLLLLLSLVGSQFAHADNPPELVDIFTQDVTRFSQLLTSPIAEKRVEGVQGLSHLKHWQSEDALIQLLNDNSPLVRREVVFALSRLGTTKSVPHLMRLLDDKSWEIRQHAHIGLCRMTAQSFPIDQQEQWEEWWKAGNVEQTLLSVLKTSEKSKDTRRATLRALRHLASPSAETALIEFLNAPHDPPLDGDELTFVCEALERVGTAKAIPTLARYHFDPAAWALGRIGGQQAEEALLRFPKTLNVLINLDRLKSTKAAPFIDHLVNSMGLVTFRGQPDDIYLGVSQPIQRVAANLIIRSGEAPKLIDLTLRELENTMKPGAPPPSREGVPPPIASLLDSMRSELKPGFVREDGVTTSQPLTALYHIANDKSLVPRLIPLLRHPAFVPRIYVAMTLGKLHATEALPAILALIREGYPFSDSTTLASGKHFDQSQAVRWRGFLCMALGKMGGDEARRALEAFATDSNATRDVRYGAVVGLRFIGSLKSLPALRKVGQEDVIWMVRETARQVAAEIELATKEGNGE